MTQTRSCPTCSPSPLSRREVGADGVRSGRTASDAPGSRRIGAGTYTLTNPVRTVRPRSLPARVLTPDPGHGVLDPLGDREPGTLGGRAGGPIASAEPGGVRHLAADDLHLRSHGLRAPAVVNALGFSKLRSEIVEAAAIRALRAGVEPGPGVARRGPIPGGEQFRDGHVLSRAREEVGDVMQAHHVPHTAEAPPPERERPVLALAAEGARFDGRPFPGLLVRGRCEELVDG